MLPSLMHAMSSLHPNIRVLSAVCAGMVFDVCTNRVFFFFKCRMYVGTSSPALSTFISKSPETTRVVIGRRSPPTVAVVCT